MSILMEAEFWVAVGFVCVVAIILSLRVPKKIGGLLDKRAEGIAKELADAKALREEAEALLESYRQKTAGVEAEAAKILADAKTAAELFATESKAQLKAQIERRAKQAQEKIAMAEAQAIAEIRGHAADTAIAAAEKIIAAKMSDARSAALIADSIQILPDKLN